MGGGGCYDESPVMIIHGLKNVGVIPYDRNRDSVVVARMDLSWWQVYGMLQVGH